MIPVLGQSIWSRPAQDTQMSHTPEFKVKTFKRRNREERKSPFRVLIKFLTTEEQCDKYPPTCSELPSSCDEEMTIHVLSIPNNNQGMNLYVLLQGVS